MNLKEKKKGHEEPRGKMGINMQTFKDTGRGKGKLGQSERVVVYIWTYIHYQM